MRIPLPALLAILTVAAAGSVVLNVTYKQAHYTIDASGLAVGQSVTVTLDHVPYNIRVLGDPNALYFVHVNITGAWVEHGYYKEVIGAVAGYAYGNETVTVGRVIRVVGTITCHVMVRREK